MRDVHRLFACSLLLSCTNPPEPANTTAAASTTDDDVTSAPPVTSSPPSTSASTSTPTSSTSGEGTTGDPGGSSTTGGGGGSSESGSSGGTTVGDGTTAGATGTTAATGITAAAFIPPDVLPESDEFDDQLNIANWFVRHIEEATPPQVTLLDMDKTTAGALTIVPLTSGWYDDFDGPFVYRMISGDFLVETHVVADSIASPGDAPSQSFNSAGIMLRNPAHAPGDEDWVLYNTGYQIAEPGTEGKITLDSMSQLTTLDGINSGTLRICRYDGTLRLLRRMDDEDEFTQEHEYVDILPEEVQVGMAVTAWNDTGQVPNYEVEPDMVGIWDYIRFYPLDGDDSLCDENF